jgi:hypothetical protein
VARTVLEVARIVRKDRNFFENLRLVKITVIRDAKSLVGAAIKIAADPLMISRRVRSILSSFHR